MKNEKNSMKQSSSENSKPTKQASSSNSETKKSNDRRCGCGE